MTTETPAEVLKDAREAVSIQHASGGYFFASEIGAMLDRLERSLAAVKVEQAVGYVNADGTVTWYTEKFCTVSFKPKAGTEIYTAPPADPAKARWENAAENYARGFPAGVGTAKASGSAPSIDLALIVGALEQSDPKAAGYPEPRERHARALEVARRLLATPPASAPEVTGWTDAMHVAAARAIWLIRREEEDRCDQELEDLPPDHSVWDEARAALTAALQEKGHE